MPLNINAAYHGYQSSILLRRKLWSPWTVQCISSPRGRVGGFVQVRERSWVPPPQDFVHLLQEEYLDHPPFTEDAKNTKAGC